MKTKNNLLPITTVHRTFETNAEGVREVTFYVSDGKTAAQWSAREMGAWLDAIRPVKSNFAVRLSTAHSADAFLGELNSRGIEVLAAHWHALGIAKGLEPDAIALAIAQAPAAAFRVFRFRKDIADLRDALACRNAVSRFYGDAVRRFKQVGRNMGIADGDEAENGLLREAFEDLDAVKDVFKADVNGKKLSLDTHVSKLAREIPECRLFNEVAGLGDSWISAASIVAYCGDFARFPAVASLWHFLGQHVTEGKAPKRKAGAAMDWNPRGKTALYLLGSSIIKNRANPWRAYYDEALAAELAVHETKHPDCPTPAGHCGARARRKMVKEIVKQFYLAVSGIDVRGQSAAETHLGRAPSEGVGHQFSEAHIESAYADS
jgi:hypothetical protein